MGKKKPRRRGPSAGRERREKFGDWPYDEDVSNPEAEARVLRAIDELEAKRMEEQRYWKMAVGHSGVTVKEIGRQARLSKRDALNALNRLERAGKVSSITLKVRRPSRRKYPSRREGELVGKEKRYFISKEARGMSDLGTKKFKRARARWRESYKGQSYWQDENGLWYYGNLTADCARDIKDFIDQKPGVTYNREMHIVRDVEGEAGIPSEFKTSKRKPRNLGAYGGPPRLVEIAKQVREIVERAQADLGRDLGGYSALDLVADNIPDVPLSTLKEALVVAGFPSGDLWRDITPSGGRKNLIGPYEDDEDLPDEEHESDWMRRWTRPPNYAGAEWPNWYVFLTQNRDSENLEKANFEAGLLELGGESDTVVVVREGHWAVGWVEWIGIHKSDAVAIQKADEMLEKIDNYPILDEEKYSELEVEDESQLLEDEFRVIPDHLQDEAYDWYREKSRETPDMDLIREITQALGEE